jgi:hypothetical protein
VSLTCLCGHVFTYLIDDFVVDKPCSYFGIHYTSVGNRRCVMYLVGLIVDMAGDRCGTGRRICNQDARLGLTSSICLHHVRWRLI